MKITGPFGYREIHKLGILLEKYGDTGRINDWQPIETDRLIINYNPYRDCFELTDGENNYAIDLSEV